MNNSFYNTSMLEDVLNIFYEDKLSVPDRKEKFKTRYKFKPTSGDSIGYITVNKGKYLVDISGRIKSTITHYNSRKDCIIKLGQDFWKSDLSESGRHAILMHEIGHIKSYTNKALYKDRNFATDDMLYSIADADEFKADRYAADFSSDKDISHALDKVKNFHIDRHVNKVISKLNKQFNMNITPDMEIGYMIGYFRQNYPHIANSFKPNITYKQAIKRIYLKEHPKIAKAVRLRKRALREL